MSDSEQYDFVANEETTYSPLDDFDESQDEEDAVLAEGQTGPVSTNLRPAYREAEVDDSPAPERIARLFKRLAPRKRIMMGILKYLMDTPKRSDALDAKVAELQEFDYSVYTGYSYSKMLYAAGAIDKVAEDGSPIDEEAEQEPDIVEIDGVKYYKPTDGKQVFWITTQDGLDFYHADDPAVRMAALLAAEEIYAPIYLRILRECDTPSGASALHMQDLIDNDPLCQNPRRFSSYFTKRLEDCDAILFSGSWKITELGHRAVEILDEMLTKAAAAITAEVASETKEA